MKEETTNLLSITSNYLKKSNHFIVKITAFKIDIFTEKASTFIITSVMFFYISCACILTFDKYLMPEFIIITISSVSVISIIKI